MKDRQIRQISELQQDYNLIFQLNGLINYYKKSSESKPKRYSLNEIMYQKYDQKFD